MPNTLSADGYYGLLQERIVTDLRARARDLRSAVREMPRTPEEVGRLRAHAEAAQVLAGQIENLRRTAEEDAP